MHGPNPALQGWLGIGTHGGGLNSGPAHPNSIHFNQETNMSITKLFTATALATALGLAGSAHAGVIIDAGPQSTAQTFSTGNYVAGTEFTVQSSLLIDGLGWLDAEGNGLNAVHTVGLWNAAGSLLAQAVINNATSTQILSAQGTAIWFVTEITDLLLAPGTYRVAGTVNDDNVALSNNKIGNGVSLSAGYVRTDFPNGGFAYPHLTFASQAIRATLTSNVFANNSMPEPTSLLLAGSGLAALRVSRKRG